MKNNYLRLAGWFPALSLLVLSACTDSAYDLSDIDTTAKFAAEELVVPINLDYAILDQVLDIDDDNEEVIDTIDAAGNKIYAIRKEGTFQSAPISVSAFTVSNVDIKSTTTQLTLEDLPPAGYPGGIKARYVIATAENPIVTTFEASTTNFDKSIKYIESVGVSTKFVIKIHLALNENGGKIASNILRNIKIEGVKIQFPEGLTAKASRGTFDPATGILDLSGQALVPDNNGDMSVTLSVTALDATKENVEASYDAGNRHLIYADQLAIVSGEANVYVDADFPRSVFLTSAPALDNIRVKSFTGRIEYEVEDFDIDPVNLGNIPDLINQSGTELMLENPQLYLSVTNPMASYDVYFKTEFQLTSRRKQKSQVFEIDANPTTGERTFRTVKGEEESHFVMTPHPDAEFRYKGYENPITVPFSGMRNILHGVDGIPTTIEVEAVNPILPEQRVENFVLGETLDAVKGRYAFYAPLQLSDDSRIVYTDTIDGWNDKDVDAITIDKLVLNFDATTEVPFEMDLTVLPLGTDGKPMEGVTSTTAHVNAQAENQPIEISIEGNITHLDGLLIKAKLVSKGSESVLSPEMKLYMDNAQATVTGYYEKEL
ncbi:MAG: hypothetical protein J6M19_03785 [Bacteroidaceae bacterium]|nr:hypothetical protein [Bacteroidaceae bacterium]